MRNKYRDMANRINAMKPGTAWRIPGHDIRDLPALPDWAFMANITMGFDRVKESVVGSMYPELWSFTEEPNGDITVYRKPERFKDMYMQKPVLTGFDPASEPDYTVEYRARRRMVDGEIEYVDIKRKRPRA